MDSQATVPGGEVMQVDGVGSPTELAGSENEVENSPNGDPHVKIEKRKRRDGQRDGRARTIPDDDDDLDSPSKRPQRCSEAPLTASEMRETAWDVFQSRIDKVESEQSKTSFEVSNLQGRTRVLEKDVASHKKVTDKNAAAIENLAHEVQGMKVRLDGMPQFPLHEGPGSAPKVSAQPPLDPWGDFLRLRDQQQLPQAHAPQQGRQGELHGRNHLGNDGDRGDMLTEDEKKTLVVGGWLQDTRRAVIEEESLILFQHESIKPLLDCDKIAVYGPRRSVGMLKFVQRDGEAFGEMKDRMWKVVKAVAALKYTTPSSRAAGEGRVLWTSFVKTRNARARSSHVSMVRRVAVLLAKDSAGQAGGVGGASDGTDPLSYDCDWNLGTIWLGCEKLGSTSHRQPREGEVITIGAGWISLSSVARAVGCSTDEAKAAFEKEL